MLLLCFAVPGCYPTAVQLGYLPLLEAGLIDPNQLIADCKSGVTGAGRGAKVASLLAEASDLQVDITLCNHGAAVLLTESSRIAVRRAG